MSSGLAETATAAAKRLLATKSVRRSVSPWAGQRLLVVGYHGVEDADVFEEQIRFLRAHYTPLAARDIIAAAEKGIPLPKWSMLVTFDDGERSILEKALPILQRHDVPAVAFVVAGLIDSNLRLWWDELIDLLARDAVVPDGLPRKAADLIRYCKKLPDQARRRLIDQLQRQFPRAPQGTPQLTADELRDLDAGGITIGNHTLTHPCLDQCDTKVVNHEIADAHAILSDILSARPRLFAYPNGNYDARAANCLDQLGYAAAFVFDHWLADRNIPDRFRISRVRANAWDALPEFASRVSGVHPLLHRLSGRP